METKSATEKFLNTHLTYLNGRPLLGSQPAAVLDPDWLKIMLDTTKGEDNKYTLSLKDKKNLPNKAGVLVLFQFFRNIDKTSSSSIIADRVVSEINKYWERSNNPTMVDWRVKKNVLGLNSSYQNLLKNIKRESTTEVTKRTNFKESLEKLFDIASQEAEKVLRKIRFWA